MRNKLAALSALLAIVGVASTASAQVAQQTTPWGEPLEGVQMRLALATSGATSLPGELPAMEVQIRNQGRTAITVNPEALIHADVEIDDVWYVQTFAFFGTAMPVVIAPGSQGNVVRTGQSVAAIMFGRNPNGIARSFDMSPGPHRIRLRNMSDDFTGGFSVRTADGKQLALISNRIDVDIPVLSASAERDALAEQVSSGGLDGILATRRLIKRYPDAAMPAIENAIAAATEPKMRARYVGEAGAIPGDRPIPFLLTQVAPGIPESVRRVAANALLVHGRQEGLWQLMETWERIDSDPLRVDEQAALLDFLMSSGNPQVFDRLARSSERSAEDRLAITRILLPPSRDDDMTALDKKRGVILAMVVSPVFSSEALPGGVAGAAAAEGLLGVLLDDTRTLPVKGRYDGVAYARPRVCDMAALAMSRRWPEKYLFKWSTRAANRDRQIAVIRAAWKKQ